MLLINFFLTVIIFAPEVLTKEDYFDYFLPNLRRVNRGPPPFAKGGNRGRDKHGPPPFAHGHGSHGHHGPPPFAHKHENCNSEYDSSEEYYDYSSEITTKRPIQTTARVYKPLSTTTDYRGLIDVRFKDDRTKRSSDSSTEILNRYNSLGHLSPWITSDPIYKPHHYFQSRLTTCVEKKFECIPAYQCKKPPRRNQEHGFCKWVQDEPYVCCEKPKMNKQQNHEYKCGNSKSSGLMQSQAIIGGVDANSGTIYPWMVAVGENAENNSVDWYCGGALISEKTVITAAHCASRRNADVIRIGEIDLKINENDTSSNLQQIKVTESLLHPLYRFPLLYNDIALLYLEKPVKFSPTARPICLPEKVSASETSIALLTGWGQLSFASQRSSILQEVTVKIFNNSYCDQQYSITQASKRNFPRGILDTQLCAGDEEGGKDACQGDSGAPLVANESGSFVLIGLVSAGIGCGTKTFPGVYTRVSSFSPWIIENML